MAPESGGVYLNVAVLDQHKVFPTKVANWACWYTSAYMVLPYRMGVTAATNVDTLFGFSGVRV